MADAAPAAATTGRTSRGSGSFWQRKEAGLPIWAWVAIVGGGAAVLFIYMRMKSSSMSSTSTTTPATTSTGPGGFGYGGYGGTGTAPSSPSPGYTGVNPGGPSPASPGNPSLPFQVQSGSGWWAGGSNWATDTPQQQQSAAAAAQAAGPITDASGNEYEWIDPQEYQSIQGSGVQVYYEVLPGVFIPVPSNMASLAPGTPLYMQVPSGTAGNPSIPAVPMAAPTVTATSTPASGATA